MIDLDDFCGSFDSNIVTGDFDLSSDTMYTKKFDQNLLYINVH